MKTNVNQPSLKASGILAQAWQARDLALAAKRNFFYNRGPVRLAWKSWKFEKVGPNILRSPSHTSSQSQWIFCGMKNELETSHYVFQTPFLVFSRNDRKSAYKPRQYR